MNPKRKFSINKEADKENLRFFLNYKSRSGQDSFAIAVQDYPELKNLREQADPERAINNFVDENYAHLKEELGCFFSRGVRVISLAVSSPSQQ